MLKRVRKLLGIDPPHEAGEQENRQRFFERIARKFPRYDVRYALIEQAYDDAKEAFRERYREGGERYFEHLRAVALIVIDYLRVSDYEVIISALLHDIVEDIPSWPIDRVAKRYGTRVACLVEFLTKWPSVQFGGNKELRDGAYHERFRNAPREFFIIKLADRLHNLLTMWDCSDEKRIRKVRETELFYMYFAERECILIHELEAAMRELTQGDG